MDDEMNGATFPTKADRLFGPNPSGLDESPHGLMVPVFHVAKHGVVAEFVAAFH